MIIVVPPASPAAVPVIEIVARDRAHERQLHVRVRVDAARHHVLAACVDDLARRAAHSSSSPTSHDSSAVAEHVGADASAPP